MELSKQLAEMAREKSICEEGFARISRSSTMEELLLYYIEGIDFCLEHNFPSKEYLKGNGGCLLKSYGIYIDENCDLVNPEFSVFLGKTVSKIDFVGYSVSEVFIKDNGFSTITVKEDAYVVIDIFDSSKMDIETSGFSKVLVNLYGDSQVSTTQLDASEIKVVRKGKRGY